MSDTIGIGPSECRNTEAMRTIMERGVGFTEGLVALATVCMLLLCLLA